MSDVGKAALCWSDLLRAGNKKADRHVAGRMRLCHKWQMLRRRHYCSCKMLGAVSEQLCEMILLYLPSKYGKMKRCHGTGSVRWGNAFAIITIHVVLMECNANETSFFFSTLTYFLRGKHSFKHVKIRKKAYIEEKKSVFNEIAILLKYHVGKTEKCKIIEIYIYDSISLNWRHIRI